MSEMTIIQLYSPYVWHDEQAIVVNEAGRQQLIKALQKGRDKIKTEAFCCDGEGFDLIIRVLPDAEIRKLKTPYTADYTHGYDADYPYP